MEMNCFTIKDLENLSGVKAHTIRIWEQRYNFLKPSRTDTNIRYYCNQELKTLLNISLLNKYGFRISHINRMTEQEVRSHVVALSDKEAVQQRMVNDLIAYMIDLDIECFEKMLDGYVHRIGILWVTGHVNPAQERLVSHIIRQRLIVGIEGTVAHRRSDTTVLLFLPEGEHHELGLLYVYYLLKTHGIKVLYLGADVPLKDVEFLCRQKEPDYLYTHLTGIVGNFSLEKFLGQVTQRFCVPLVISGELARAQLPEVPERLKNIDLRRSVPEVLEFVASL
jgi:DNA-binding transcriptional MerR regulator